MDFIGVIITSGITLLLPIIGGAVIWGKMKQSMQSHEESIKDLKNGLYKEDMTPIYVSETGCINRHGECQRTMCSKIDEVKTQIKDLSKEIQVGREQHEIELRKILIFMGRVEEFMKVK